MVWVRAHFFFFVRRRAKGTGGELVAGVTFSLRPIVWDGRMEWGALVDLGERAQRLREEEKKEWWVWWVGPSE